ncbi:MAG TPA: hypothetical protein VIK89_06520 [Cytophagaceae bacterium]
MKKRHVVMYHSVYWIYRVVNILTFNYFLYQENWYRGAYVVQLVLMPFFYINYGVLIPTLLKKQFIRFVVLTILWIAGFVQVYSVWTAYQRNWLYGETVASPDYIETLNNLIYIWLISAAFCLFEYWIKNLKKIQELALNKKKHLLKTEENKMLSHLLSENLNMLPSISSEVLPDKIIKVSELFKYILYNRDHQVPFKTELYFIKIFEELRNAHIDRVKIYYGYLDEQFPVMSTRVIVILNRLVDILYKNKPVSVTVELGISNEILIYVSLPDKRDIERISKEFPRYSFDVDLNKGRMIIPIDQQYYEQAVVT